ncbi:hypothetical protein F5148DRAFT_987770 [Russula earlei]|uniref:Uncharacterized protein n=1 Tax=Russula earlei TaxID=71964 RepID=A0ACC0TTY5_9AGAM|nr:hypothetical protein F5148DRAFT_987770 [Russula earlei]
MSDFLKVCRVEATCYEQSQLEEPQSTPFCLPSPLPLTVPEPEYSLPLQEVDITFTPGLTEPGVIDPGSQIIVIRQDLAREVNTKINYGQHLAMESANRLTSWMVGCTENLPMRIGDIPFVLHTYVVEHAPMRLLLGRPFQQLLLTQLEDFPNGKVELSICDPCNPSR